MSTDPRTTTEVDPSVIQDYVNPGPQAAFWHQGGQAGGFSAVGESPLPNYSFAEQPNGRLWVDGSAVYQKTIDLGMLPNAGTNDIPHNIEGIAEMIELQGAATDAAGPYFIRLPHVDQNPSFNVGFFVDGTNVQVVSGADRSNYHGFCTLIYTCTDR